MTVGEWHTVTADDTARALGSGDVEVLGTPRLLAWCEQATLSAIADLPPGTTTVGSHMVVEHLKPSPVGARIEVTARLAVREGRRLVFEVVAEQGGPTSAVEVGRATVTRVIVDRDRF